MLEAKFAYSQFFFFFSLKKMILTSTDGVMREFSVNTKTGWPTKQSHIETVSLQD